MSTSELDLESFTAKSAEEVRAELIQLKGIGHWTIDVYLMFVLQRADIFPMGDLAAINALRRVKQLPKDTARDHLQELTASWQPYRSVATMLLWHLYLSSPMRQRA